jgi:hypothetical protein
VLAPISYHERNRRRPDSQLPFQRRPLTHRRSFPLQGGTDRFGGVTATKPGEIRLTYLPYELGADAEGVAWLRRSIEANRNLPIAHFYLAAGLALLGSLDEARAAVQAGLALYPNLTLRRFRAGAASSTPTFLAQRERIIEGMRLAGVPEG